MGKLSHIGKLTERINGDKMKYTLLDGRHNGYGDFMYSVESDSKMLAGYKKTNKAMYLIIRTWMHDTFGNSIPLGYNGIGKMLMSEYPTIMNGSWAYDDERRRIYLRSDKELTLFKLKWE